MTSTTATPVFSFGSETRKPENLLKWVALLAIAATIAKSVVAAVGVAHTPWLVTNYVASQWWLSYDLGFVRRGLPGQVLAWAVGGTPSAWQVTGASLVMTSAAVVALIWLTWVVARGAAPNVQLAVAALITVSPFTVSEYVRYLGGYDAIGVLALVAIVAVAGPRRSAPVVVGIAVLLAGLTEEFLVAFVVPVAVLVLASGRSGRQRYAVPAAAILPGVMATLVSFAMRPSVPDLAAAESAAHAARPDITPGGVTAIAALSQGSETPLDYLASMAWWVLPVATAILGGCYLMGTALLWHFLARPASFNRYVIWFVLCAVGLSLIAEDYQRWWSMAFVASVAVLAVLPRSADRPPVDPSRRLVAVVAVVLALNVVGQVSGITAERLDMNSGVAVHLPPTSA